jgi:hypothetical protein
MKQINGLKVVLVEQNNREMIGGCERFVCFDKKIK